MKIDVCICTHNPRKHVFRWVLEALCRQTVNKRSFHVWIIDNASNPPLHRKDFRILEDSGVSFTLLREERLGNVYARERAIRATRSEWIVFVDDDNELADDYLENAISIAEYHPQMGCFGGKLLLPKNLSVPRWAKPLLPYLAIKDYGEDVITNCIDKWGAWEPPTAGAVVRLPVLDLFLQQLERTKFATCLGRKGRNGLFSSEDSLMMRGAFKLELTSSYQPRLKLVHHIDPPRLRFIYLLRLCFHYGRSEVILERCLGNEANVASANYLWRLLTNFPRSRAKTCRLARKWGFLMQSYLPQPITLEQEQPLPTSAALDPVTKP
jgi:glycosyltransferase involved in cell wall biosynthesis